MYVFAPIFFYFFEVSNFDHFWRFFGVRIKKIIKKYFLGVFSHEKSFAPSFIYFKKYILRKKRFFGFCKKLLTRRAVEKIKSQKKLKL